jgi:hypothetical protein
MTIDRQHSRLVFSCDSCDATFEGSPDDDFVHAWAAAKAEGWKARKIGKEWVHACPDCELDR